MLPEVLIKGHRRLPLQWLAVVVLVYTCLDEQTQTSVAEGRLVASASSSTSPVRSIVIQSAQDMLYTVICWWTSTIILLCVCVLYVCVLCVLYVCCVCVCVCVYA